MEKTYHYALGIDLGIASLGTGLVALNSEGKPKSFLDAGVRIFAIPLGAAERRANRLARQSKHHKQSRIRKLQKYLQQEGLLPVDASTLKQLKDISPHTLRSQGIKQPFDTIHKFGRCLLHMVAFRGAGFLSEDTSSDINDDSEKAAKEQQKTANTYTKLRHILDEKKCSLSQYFAERLEKNLPVRQRIRFKDENGIVSQESENDFQKIVNYAVPRYLVKREFKQLWDTQAKTFSQLTESVYEKLYDLIFVDNPSAPYANAPCSLFRDEMRLPTMHRLAEKRRIYEQINNIRFIAAHDVCCLTKAMRDALIKEVMQGNELRKTSIKQCIQAMHAEKITSINVDEERTSSAIKGFCLITAFADVLEWNKLSDEERDTFIEFLADPIREESDVHRPTLYNEDEVLRHSLKLLGMEGEDDAKRLSDAIKKLPKGRSHLGRTATEKILEKLEEGTNDPTKGWRAISHREAAELCQFKAEATVIEEQANTLPTLPYYGKVLEYDVCPIHPWHKERATADEKKYGRVPNPVVHVALNQLRKIVNETIELYGKPTRIHLELAREFGMSAKKRDELKKEQEKNTKANAKLDDQLRENGFRATRKNRIKYRLWEEQNHRDIYTLENIPLSDLSGCEIDHIIPVSQGASDTYANLVLTSVNADKSNTPAYQFIQQNYKDNWPGILSLIQSSNYPKNKAWRFSADAHERFLQDGDDDHTDRRSTDTSYMAKLAQRYLKVICKEVVPIRGGMTAQLRHQWGVDGLEYELMKLSISKFLDDDFKSDPDTGEVWQCRNPLWFAKPRIDHRHHAIDALVLACTTRGMMQSLARAANIGKRIEMPVPFAEHGAAYRQRMQALLERIKISHKPEHNPLSQLHNETAYRVLEYDSKKKLYTTVFQRKLEDIGSKAKVQNIYNTTVLETPVTKKYIETCKDYVQQIESFYQEAQKSLELGNAQAQNEGKKVYTINEKMLVAEAIRLAKKNGKIKATYPCLANAKLVNIRPIQQCGYEPDGNFCMDFFENDKGKVGWECTSTFDANQKDFTPAWQKADYKHIWRLHKGDMLELKPEGKLKEKLPMGLKEADTILATVQKFSEGIMTIMFAHDARPKDIKQGLPAWNSGNTGLSFFTKAQARKIKLSPFGKVRRRHKRLWDGKKTPSTE